MKYQMASMISACAVSCCMLCAGAVTAHAEKTELLCASDYILKDSQGNAYCKNASGTGYRTGKFSISPNYLMGDIDQSGRTDSADAAVLLGISAKAGSGQNTAETLLQKEISGYSIEEVKKLSDIDQNQAINSADAAEILEYSAKSGVNQVLPLGTAYYYANSKGYLQKGMITVGSVTYYADENYRLVKGLQKIGDDFYYFDENYIRCTGWLTLNGKKYYFGADGAAYTGQRVINNQTYYFDETGKLLSGWKENGNQKYYYDESGKMASGWQTIDNQKYYFDPETNIMLTGFQMIDNQKYYFNTDGILQTDWFKADNQNYYASDGILQAGWTELSGNQYYFDTESNIMLTGFQTIDTQKYYFDTDGILQTDWFTVDNQKYYAPDGIIQTGWIEVSGNKYYLDPETGAVQTGAVTIDGKDYFMNEEGIMQTGKQTIDGIDYYFSTETGERITIGWKAENGSICYIDEDGSKHKGWLTLDGKTYYMDNETGACLSGWQELVPPDDDTWTPDLDNQDNWTDEDWDRYYEYMWGTPSTKTYFYYFSPVDDTMQTGWLELPEGTYYLDDNGRRHFGFLEYEGKIYGFDENGLMIKNKQLSNGRYDQNGYFIKSNYDIPLEIRQLLDNAELKPGIRHIDVKNRQTNVLYTKDSDLPRGINLTDNDYAIIEKFAAEHFSPDMTLSERLYETWWWIHCNVDYAYAGEKWNKIESKSYPDAIFNYKLGQCVQYNGAMAAVLAYYGFDVYMVKGWTHPDFTNYKNSYSQHYWTEVMINGTRYYVETGNQGKNGDHWQYFFVDAETVSYTKTP